MGTPEHEPLDLTDTEMEAWLNRRLPAVFRNGQIVELCPPPDYGRPRANRDASEKGHVACGDSVEFEDDFYEDFEDEVAS